MPRPIDRIQRLMTSARGWARSYHPLRSTEASYVILIVSVGILGGLVGLLYQLGLKIFQLAYFASNESILDIAEGLTWQRRLIAPAAGAFVAAMVIRYGLRETGGEGMAEIMEAVVLKEKLLRVRRALWKGLSSLIAIGSGGSIGREGPMVQISAAAAGRIAEMMRLSAERRRILIGCGVAAGMAAAYHAPIGAALFVMEVIIGNFAMEIFGPLVIASVVATLVSHGVLGGPIYHVPELSLVSAWEFVPYVGLGIACALIGRLFIAVMSGTTWAFGKLPAPHWLRATLGGLGVGAIAIWVPHVWGNGYEGVNLALTGEMPVQLLAWALAGKMVASALSIGSGSSGGVFTATLFLGATFGGLVGSAAHSLWPGLTAPPAAYALVGMSGLLAATTHAPIMSTLMVFEMSLNYNLILPVLICSGVAALISRAIRRDSIYTERLRQRGVDIDLAIEETALSSIHCADVMWANPPTVTAHTPLRTLLDKFLHMKGEGIHVVEEDRRYVGLIDVHDLLAATEQKALEQLLIAGDLAREVPHVKGTDPVSAVTEKFWFLEHGELPVLSDDDPPRFLGVVTRRDVLRAFDKEVLQRKLMTVRYAGGGQSGTPPGRARRGGILDLPVEFAIEELPVPASLVGSTLTELDLPHKYLLTALALKPANGATAEMIPPPIDRALSQGDRLVLVGKRQDLARFAQA
ncbi:MAG TPA: chloride channel protein [Candidatus Polarisedimenticolia bacterium]|jgi:CIC family chloride channel protein